MKAIKIPPHFYITFSVSIFLGAFLLFQIQPIISKYILPWFGGSSSVWITAILYFQILLLFGYLYVYLISKISLKKQILIHGLIISTVAVSVILLLTGSKIPVFPGLESKLNDNYSPVIQVLWILLIGTGITYFILSTTSVLLQKWFTLTFRDKSPYIFYSLSNIASLFALISYPIFVEPIFKLRFQGLNWSVGFIIYSVFLLICCAQTFFFKYSNKIKPAIVTNLNKVNNKLSKKTILFWILLSAISSLMLLSTTNLITQSVASVPFLWILPLSIYLLSFIICFGNQKWYNKNLYAYISLIMGFISLTFIFSNIPSIIIGLIIYCLMLFSVCMICHGELYKIRPSALHLDLYYLLIAFGSALSGIFVGIIAPLYFNGIWEIYLAFYLAFLLTIWVLIHYKNLLFYRLIGFLAFSHKDAFNFSLIAYPLTIIIAIFVINILSGNNSFTLKVWRNFYGILTVKQNFSQNINVLVYGNIIHGSQFLGKAQNEPTTYYGKKSGVGITIANDPQFRDKTNIGIIGLGTGTLAAYGKKEDSITFFEINPNIIDVAQNSFTYLKNSKAAVNIILGDGRLSLENEIRQNKPKFDLLVIDAFSDDSIPIHLLTKEAFEIYLNRLNKEKGIIAVHISNKYIDLKPVLIQAAAYYKLNYATFLLTKGDKFNLASNWLLLTYNKKLFEIPAISKAIYIDNKQSKEIALWTDDYSNLFQVLK